MMLRDSLAEQLFILKHRSQPGMPLDIYISGHKICYLLAGTLSHKGGNFFCISANENKLFIFFIILTPGKKTCQMGNAGKKKGIDKWNSCPAAVSRGPAVINNNKYYGTIGNITKNRIAFSSRQ